MTDLMPPVETTEPTPEPVKPSEKRTWPWTATLVTALAVLTVAGVAVAVSGQQTPTTAPSLPDQFGRHACTTGVAEAYPDARDGVAVIVHAPGPAVVDVSVSGGVDQGGSLSQQVTRRAQGAQFDFPRATPVDMILVTIYHNMDSASCYVPIPDALK